MKIYADDGKEFTTVDECNAYESDLALKKQKEEEDRKSKERRKEYLWNQMMSKLEELNNIVDTYTKEDNENLYLTSDNGKLEIKKCATWHNIMW